MTGPRKRTGSKPTPKKRTASGRPTLTTRVNGVEEKLGGLGNVVDELLARATELESSKEEIEKQVAQLQRKSQGTTRANTEIVRLERQLVEIREALDKVQPVLSTADPAVISQLVREFEGRVAMVGMETARAHDRLDDIENSSVFDVDFDNSKLKLGGSIEVKVPWFLALVTGLGTFIVALLAFDAWWEELSDNQVLFASGIVAVVAFLVASSFETFTLNLRGKIVWAEWKRPSMETVIEIPLGLPDDPPAIEAPLVPVPSAQAHVDRINQELRDDQVDETKVMDIEQQEVVA